jgi:hypothetical protein
MTATTSKTKTKTTKATKPKTISPTEKIHGLIEGKVTEIVAEDADVLLSEASIEIVEYVRRTDPDALIDWFWNHAVGLVRQQLQARMAVLRRGTRVGVFQERNVAPFNRRYAVEGHVWRRIGDMCRPDWRYLIDERSQLARANLFDIALAKRMVDRLPDDVTPTKEVVDEAELQRLEREAEKAAQRAVASF